MASKKISELTELLAPDGDDYYVVVDSDADETKKIKLSLGGGVGFTTYNMTSGQTDLAVGTHLKDMPIEVVFLGASTSETLSMITGSRDGNMKILIATGGNVTVRRNDSYMKTNNPVANPDFAMHQGDVLVLANVGGDPSSCLNGTWLEVNRKLQV